MKAYANAQAAYDAKDAKTDYGPAEGYDSRLASDLKRLEGADESVNAGPVFDDSKKIRSSKDNDPDDVIPL